MSPESATHPSDHPFSDRRAAVLEALGDRSAMILAAAPELVAARDIELPYFVDPDLWYLTGYEEPEAVAVLCPSAEAPFTLFVRDRDPAAEVWTGPREDPADAGERVGADAVHPVAQLKQRLPGLLSETDRLHYRVGGGRRDVEALVLEILGRGRARRQRKGRGPAELADPGLVLDDMRLVKSAGEIAAIRDAVAITTQAFREGLAMVEPGAGEWQIQAAVEYAFRDAGADGPAFATIAASGANATVLHYTANRRAMRAGDLLLLDAGARHRIYNADLTRTVPVDGRWEGAARDMYDAVLEAERAAIDAARPGATTADLHEAVLNTLLPAMLDLGLVQGPLDTLREREAAWKPFFPHSTSHWLGLDVHDVGTYAVDGTPRPLEPGMVLTVEPGLYVTADDLDAPAHLRGLGIRTEDDLLITEDGCDVLSADLPTDAAEIAALVGIE